FGQSSSRLLVRAVKSAACRGGGGVTRITGGQGDRGRAGHDVLATLVDRAGLQVDDVLAVLVDAFAGDGSRELNDVGQEDEAAIPGLAGLDEAVIAAPVGEVVDLPALALEADVIG